MKESALDIDTYTGYSVRNEADRFLVRKLGSAVVHHDVPAPLQVVNN